MTTEQITAINNAMSMLSMMALDDNGANSVEAFEEYVKEHITALEDSKVDNHIIEHVKALCDSRMPIIRDSILSSMAYDDCDLDWYDDTFFYEEDTPSND